MGAYDEVCGAFPQGFQKKPSAFALDASRYECDTHPQR